MLKIIFGILICLASLSHEVRIPSLLLPQFGGTRAILPSVRLQFNQGSSSNRVTANVENLLEQEWSDFKVSWINLQTSNDNMWDYNQLQIWGINYNMLFCYNLQCFRMKLDNNRQIEDILYCTKKLEVLCGNQLLI